MEQIGRAHLTWRRHVARGLAPHEITPKQIFLLRQLRAQKALAPSDIATLIYADRPTVTAMIGTLERAGWVTRRRDPDNGKRVLVELTRAGRAKLDGVPEALWRSGKTRVDPVGGLTAAERKTLTRLLGKLNAALEAL